jgi:hypothetical protein
LQVAERDGLLQFFDREPAPRLDGIVLTPARGNVADGWIESIDSASEQAERFVAIDSPDFLPMTPSEATEWAREFAIAVMASRLRAVVNLNAALPPAWAMNGPGPMTDSVMNDDSFRRQSVAFAIAESLFESHSDRIRVDWHLRDADFRSANKDSLPRLAAWVIAGRPLTFVPDRPRRPITLAEGLDRYHPAVLAIVGVGLPALLKKSSENVSTAEKSPDAFLSKLGSLVRLALAAGNARRSFLRQHAPVAVTAEFLLDRARLMVVPIGLEEVLWSLGGSMPSGEGLNTARNILLGLNAALQRDAVRVPAVLEGATSIVASQLNPRQQLRDAAALHTVIGTGWAEITTSDHTQAEIADLLRYAWQQSGLGRFTLATTRQKLARW